MIIFLYGKDTYRLQQKLKEIEAQYKEIHKSGLNLEKIDALQIEFEEFTDKLFQYSMFIEKKLFFLENLFSSQKFKEKFLEKIKEIAKSQDLIVVFEKKELLKKDKLFLGLKKYGKSQEFESLKGKMLENWIKNEFQKEKIKVSEQAMNLLLEFIGNDLWQLSNEIKKLVCLKKPLKANDLIEEVKSKDIEILVKPKLEANIFKIIDALSQKNKKKALKLIQESLLKENKPLAILNMINFQFRGLLIAKTLMEEGKTLDDFLKLNILKPYPTRKCWYASTGFSLNQLKKIYQKIFEADLSIKTGKIQPEEGLKMLVAEI
jgi:DNA polymerase-3 subunit delta